MTQMKKYVPTIPPPPTGWGMVGTYLMEEALLEEARDNNPLFHKVLRTEKQYNTPQHNNPHYNKPTAGVQT